MVRRNIARDLRVRLPRLRAGAPSLRRARTARWTVFVAGLPAGLSAWLSPGSSSGAPPRSDGESSKSRLGPPRFFRPCRHAIRLSPARNERAREDRNLPGLRRGYSICSPLPCARGLFAVLGGGLGEPGTPSGDASSTQRMALSRRRTKNGTPSHRLIRRPFLA